MKTVDELIESVQVWGEDRGLLVRQHDRSYGLWVEDDGRARAQLLKCMSELGELADAVLKGDHHDMRDGLGDVLVTLIMFAGNSGLTIRGSLNAAWEEIRDRRGTTVNGAFIKEVPNGNG
jgi:NTP pyrophosphatase (non-canonical NTP hydrolase)